MIAIAVARPGSSSPILPFTQSDAANIQKNLRTVESMVMKYDHLKKYPDIFVKLTGLQVGDFDHLLDDIVPHYMQVENRRLSRLDRQRAIGGGDRCELEVRDQVLLTVIWLRLYPRQEVLGNFFGVSQPTASRYIARMIPVIEQTAWNSLRCPDPGRKQRRDLRRLLLDIPELLKLITTFVTPHARSNNVSNHVGELWSPGANGD